MTTIGDDNERIRAELFVGRDDELARLERLMTPGGPHLALVSGPGGVGKTELLAALARRARALGVSVARLDGGLVAPSEAAVADALRQAMEAAGAGHDPRALLLIDRYESLAALDGWVRDVLVPSLPATTRVVIAGRDGMRDWLTHAPWRGAIEPIALGPLAPSGAIEYLTRRGVPPDRHADITRSARGHPLALVLFAELVRRDPTSATGLAEQPMIVQALLERFVAATPEPERREALWCGAVVMRLTEELLDGMTGGGSSRATFEWLRGLPFVAVTPQGLELHDLVRELLDADLAWRFPALRRRLIGRAARHFRALAERSATRSITLSLEVAYLWRDAIPYTVGDTTGCSASVMRPTDRDDLAAMITRHQGEAAWRWFERWCAHGAEVLVVRGPGGRPQAVALYLRLDRVDPELARQDPGCAGVMACLEATGELRGMVYRRFHVDRDAHQGLAPSTLIITANEFEMHVCQPWMRNALRAWLDPEVGLRELPQGMLERLSQADFDQGDRRFHVIRTTARGDYLPWCLDRVFMPLFSPEVAPDDEATSPPGELAALTGRQREVAALVSEGLTNKEIATRLGTSAHTVRNQLVDIFGRLGISTRSELAAIAVRASVQAVARTPKAPR